MDEPQRKLRNVPFSELDLQMQLTHPDWGDNINISDELKEKLKNIIVEEYKKGDKYRDSQGNINIANEDVKILNKQSMWGLLGFYTKDVRLGNLNPKMFEYCRYWFDVASDAIQMNYSTAFLTALSRAISVLELSQSIEGFLRKQSNTLTMENRQNPLEPDKGTDILGRKRK